MVNAPTVPTTPDADDQLHQTSEPVTELVERSFGGKAGEAGQEGGLHRLEEEERDPGQQHAERELRDPFVPVLTEQLRGDRAGVEEATRGDGAEQEPAEVLTHLVPRGRGPGLGGESPGQRETDDRDQRGQRDRERVRCRVLDVEQRQDENRRRCGSRRRLPIISA